MYSYSERVLHLVVQVCLHLFLCLYSKPVCLTEKKDIYVLMLSYG